MLLFRCSVTQSATRTVKKFGGPDAACHGRDDATSRARDPAHIATVVNDLLPGRQKPANAPLTFLNPRFGLTRGLGEPAAGRTPFVLPEQALLLSF